MSSGENNATQKQSKRRRLHTMFIVGLTGGIGSGKSTVSTFFTELGIVVIDADQIAREVTAEKSTTEKIIQHFGANILLQDQQIDRAKLRDIIFNSAIEREWLEQLLHPLIATKIQQHIHAAKTPYVVLAIPLLLEKGRRIHVDRVLVVDSDETLQNQRVQQRDKMNAAQFEAIKKTQLDRSTRLKLADDIIYNNGSLLELKQQVEKLHQKYLLITQ